MFTLTLLYLIFACKLRIPKVLKEAFELMMTQNKSHFESKTHLKVKLFMGMILC